MQIGTTKNTIIKIMVGARYAYAFSSLFSLDLVDLANRQTPPSLPWVLL
jgi:hypothetical protein